jgi:hypothetical protein
MSRGLAALNVLLNLGAEALLIGLTLGNLILTFEKTLECSLMASLSETTLVLMIWIDSGGALCLPLKSMSTYEG